MRLTTTTNNKGQSTIDSGQCKSHHKQRGWRMATSSPQHTDGLVATVMLLLFLAWQQLSTDNCKTAKWIMLKKNNQLAATAVATKATINCSGNKGNNQPRWQQRQQSTCGDRITTASGGNKNSGSNLQDGARCDDCVFGHIAQRLIVFSIFAGFSLLQNAGCLPALPDVAAQCRQCCLLGGWLSSQFFAAFSLSQNSGCLPALPHCRKSLLGGWLSFQFFLAAFSLFKMPNASLHFQMWWLNAANATSWRLIVFFNFLPLFPSPHNAGCLPALRTAANASLEVDCLFNVLAAFSDAPLQFRMWRRNAASLEVDCLFKFWLLFPSLIMLDASLHFRIWRRNAANTASLEADCLFKFLAAFSLSKNAGCLPALPVVAAQRCQHRLLGSWLSLQSICRFSPLAKRRMPPWTSGSGGTMLPMPPSWKLIVFSIFWPLFLSLKMPDASLHFRMWRRIAANTASSLFCRLQPSLMPLPDVSLWLRNNAKATSSHCLLFYYL